MIAAPTLNAALPSQIASAAHSAGLHVLATAHRTSHDGTPTTQFTLALTGQESPTAPLELSSPFDPTLHTKELATFLAETAARLRTPRPDVILTLTGIPLAYAPFEWPFHHSSAGADTAVVHGLVTLADATDSPLHAKLAAAMTVTFREVVLAPEQPFAESFILNAIRKTFDQGQLELVRSGNRQPVPVTTRFYSPRHNKFVFNDTTEPQRKQFLLDKTFWLSGILGTQAPSGSAVWLLDPRDAQYLNTTVEDLATQAQSLAAESLITLGKDGYATPTPALMSREPQYRTHLAEALAFIKPSFNEDMRAGNTNM